MPSAVLAWLDCSEADQRRAREIVAMFSQPESRDELGLGQIRDALGDTLFPGTSVLLTRARYLLFVPWFCREGARRGRQGSQLSSWVDAQERRLIGALRNGEDTSGLIGGVVGERVQNLPSTIYWNSLRRFGILRHDGSPAQIAGLRQVSRPLDDATEFVERPDAVWDPSMPAPPEDFFALTSCDFALSRDEATWLAERIRQAAPDTLLEFLVGKGNRRPEIAPFAWADDEANAATGQVRDALSEARRFAVAMHGAALLYNVLLTERAEQLGLSQHDGRRDYFADWLGRWRNEVEEHALTEWNLYQLWALVAAQGKPVSPSTRAFVTQWVSLIRGPSGLDLAGDRAARNLIREREIHQKRGQARLTIEGVDTESDLTTADRDFLIAIIAQLQATVLEQQRVIERLERRIAELEGRAKPDGPPRMPGLKAKSGRQPPAQQQPRKQRRHGFARPRMTPTHRVEHVEESCPDCGTHLTGGWVQRTREVIELPVVPVQVTEHVFFARTCPVCRRRRVPTTQLDGVALGRQRLETGPESPGCGRRISEVKPT